MLTTFAAALSKQPGYWHCFLAIGLARLVSAGRFSHCSVFPLMTCSASQLLAGSPFVREFWDPSGFFQTHRHTRLSPYWTILDMIAIAGTSDQPCWLVEA